MAGGVDDTLADVLEQAEDGDLAGLADLLGTEQRLDQEVGQEPVADLRVLQRGLVGRRRGQDEAAVAGELLKQRRLGQHRLRRRLDLQHLRPHRAREAAVKDADELAGGNPLEPLGQLIERDAGAGEVEDVGVESNELMRLAAVAGKTDDDEVVGIDGSQGRELCCDRCPRRLLADEELGAVAEGV